MTVGSVMTKAVFTVRMDDTIGTMKEILRHAPFHHLLVVEDHRLVGILSDRDILKNISPFLDTLSENIRDLSILNRRVHQFMTHKPITVTRETSAKVAADLLLKHHISCLPVVSSSGEVEGVTCPPETIPVYVPVFWYIWTGQERGNFYGQAYPCGEGDPDTSRGRGTSGSGQHRRGGVPEVGSL
jgi:acetoin utilization protein AcuB